jgi:hypothetical protein
MSREDLAQLVREMSDMLQVLRREPASPAGLQRVAAVRGALLAWEALPAGVVVEPVQTNGFSAGFSVRLPGGRVWLSVIPGTQSGEYAEIMAYGLAAPIYSGRDAQTNRAEPHVTSVKVFASAAAFHAEVARLAALAGAGKL